MSYIYDTLTESLCQYIYHTYVYIYILVCVGVYVYVCVCVCVCVYRTMKMTHTKYTNIGL
jgi:hypothetical protein